MSKQFVQHLSVDWDSVPSRAAYPFHLPLIRKLGRIAMHPSVTYFVGENGTGKSTLLEAVAVALGFNAEGGTRGFSHNNRASHSSLYRHLTISRGAVPRDGFFLRAESYFNLATEIEWMDSIEEREEIRSPPPKVIDSYGGKSLHEQSHGESFFALFMNRFGGQGLYILDEPEAALSPNRQMSFLTRVQELVRQGSQFLIATHSPIVLAYPDAQIYELSTDGAEPVSYDATDTVQVTRRFLNQRKELLDILLGEDGSAP